MSTLDPPAAAARRQLVLDRIAEDLTGWGCPAEYAEARAARLLDHALDAGYALPTALNGPPAHGGASTVAGRTRARLLFAHRLIGGVGGGEIRCSCGQWSGPHEEHGQHVAAMLVVAGVATASEQHHARHGSAAPGPAAPPGPGTPDNTGCADPGATQRVEDRRC